MEYPRSEWAEEADTAHISFRDVGAREVDERISAADESGGTGIVPDLAPSGELVEIELLDAERRMPRMFRG